MRIIAGLTLPLLLAAAPMNAVAQEAAAQEVAAAEAVADVDAAERLALSNRFIALMQTDQMSATFSQMMGIMVPDGPGMTAERSAGLQRAMTRMSTEMFPRLFAIMTPIYADIFSLEELRGLVAFYESDIGQSMIRKSQEAGPRAAAAMMAILPEIRRDMAVVMCEEMGCTDAQRARMAGAATQPNTP